MTGAAGREGRGRAAVGYHFRSGTGRNTTDVLLTCLKALGTGATSAGAGAGLSTTAISELLV